MKKLMALFLAAAMMVSMTACGGGESSSTEDNSEPTVVSTPEPDKTTEDSFTKSELLVGYNVFYPEETGKLERSDFGFKWIHH